MSINPLPPPSSSEPAKIPKFSRYKSVRRGTATATTTANVPPPPPSKQSQTDAIPESNAENESDSSSRGVDDYTPPPSMQEGQEQGQGVAQQQQGPGMSRSMSMSRYKRPTRENAKLESAKARPLETIPQFEESQDQPRGESKQMLGNSVATARIDEEDARMAEKEQTVTETQRREAETQDAAAAQILAELQRKDAARLEIELANATSKEQISSPKEKFGFLSRRFGTTKTLPSRVMGAMEQSGSSIGRSKTQRLNAKSSGKSKSLETTQRLDAVQEPVSKSAFPTKDTPNAILKGGGGIVPQTNAPVSAFNAGERLVQVRCKQSSINLPVTPETTVLDLLQSAANSMSQDISTSHSILFESYDRLGLERRLRRYEHVRDIMNSWDTDQQNTLTVENSDAPQRDYDLAYSHAPKTAPKDLTVYMYYSQHPGKWSKRYITLLSMGQIFVSKRPNAKVTDKDVVSICHLSDFDIYTPTPRQARKYLKPPKKTCHAIKSQQKTNIFLNTENFVHFFSTDDEALAEKWYSTVQQWRSWYLVYRMGGGNKLTRSRTTKRLSGDPLSSRSAHTSTSPVDRSPYTAGLFHQSDRHASPPNVQIIDDDSDEENRPRQVPFHLRHGAPSPPPPTSEYQRFLANAAANPNSTSNQRLIMTDSPEEEFASTGLLGRSYTQRRQGQQQRQNQQRQGSGTSPPRSSSQSGTSTSGGRQKPLLDFTPSFKEAPQWDRSRKGHGVRGVQGVPLVEMATGPAGGGMGLSRGSSVLRRDDTVFRRES